MFKKKNKSIERRSALGTATVMDGETRAYEPSAIKKVLEEKGLSASETVTVENPVTGKSAIVTIARDGTPDSKLVMALADKNMNRDQKDSVLSLYLFERGKENASFLMDLMRFKGAHTKETQAFKSQVRFDFEMFVSLFTRHLDSVAKDVFKELGIVDYRAFLEGYVKYLKERGESATVGSFGATLGFNWDVATASLVVMAIRDIETSDRMKDAVKRITDSRLKDKGYGVYINKDGRSYSIFDEDLDEAVKADRERVQDLNKNI